MFLWRWLKKLLFLIGLGTVIWWGIQFIKANSPVRQKVDNFKQSSMWQEGVKDMKTWAGELFKGVGQKLEEDVGDDDRKKLDEILRKELGVKGQGSEVKGQRSRAKGEKP